MDFFGHGDRILFDAPRRVGEQADGREPVAVLVLSDRAGDLARSDRREGLLVVVEGEDRDAVETAQFLNRDERGGPAVGEEPDDAVDRGR